MKLSLKFYWDNSPGSLIEKELANHQKEIENQILEAIEIFPLGYSWGDYAESIAKIRELVLAPPFCIQTDEEKPLRELLILAAKERVAHLISKLDEADDFLSRVEGGPKHRQQRKVERLREQINQWWMDIDEGHIEVEELIPSFDVEDGVTFSSSKQSVLNSTPAQVKRLIWNGAKNALADVFYQLKTLCTDENKPFLDASNEQIAEFLKMNFECFNDTQISTIKEYLEKDEKRPKKATSKISLMRGFPPKE